MNIIKQFSYTQNPGVGKQRSFAISQTFKGKVVSLEHIFTSGNCSIKGGTNETDPKILLLEDLLIQCFHDKTYTDIDPLRDRAANAENNNIYKKGFYIMPSSELKIGSLPRKFDSNREWIGGTNRKFSSKTTSESIEYRTFSSRVEEFSLRIFGNSALGYLVWYWPKVPRKFIGNPLYGNDNIAPPTPQTPLTPQIPPQKTSPLSLETNSYYNNTNLMFEHYDHKGEFLSHTFSQPTVLQKTPIVKEAPHQSMSSSDLCISNGTNSTNQTSFDFHYNFANNNNNNSNSVSRGTPTRSKLSASDIPLRKKFPADKRSSPSSRHPPFITPDNSHFFLFHYLANEGVCNSNEEELNYLVTQLNNHKRKRESYEDLSNPTSNSWVTQEQKRKAGVNAPPTSYPQGPLVHVDQPAQSSFDLMPYFERSQFDPPLQDGVLGIVPAEKNKIDFVIGNFKPGCYVQLEQQKDGLRIDGPIEILTTRSYFQITHFWREQLSAPEFVDLSLLYPNKDRIRERIQFEILPLRKCEDEERGFISLNTPSPNNNNYSTSSSPETQSPESPLEEFINEFPIDYQGFFTNYQYSPHLVSLLLQQHLQQLNYHQNSHMVASPSETSYQIESRINNNRQINHTSWKSHFPTSFSSFKYTATKPHERNSNRNISTDNIHYHPLALLESLVSPDQPLLHSIVLFGGFKAIDKIIKLSVFNREEWLLKNNRNETAIDLLTQNQFLTDRQRSKLQYLITNAISGGSTLLSQILPNGSDSSYTSKHADFAHFAIPCDRATKYSMLLFISEIQSSGKEKSELTQNLRSSSSNLSRSVKLRDSPYKRTLNRNFSASNRSSLLSRASSDSQHNHDQSNHDSKEVKDNDLEFPEGRGAVVAVVGRDPKRRLLYSKDTRHPNLTHLAVSSAASGFLAGYSVYDDADSDDDESTDETTTDETTESDEDDFPLFNDDDEEEEEEKSKCETNSPHQSPRQSPRASPRQHRSTESEIPLRQRIRTKKEEETMLKRRLSNIVHRKTIKNSTGIAKVDIGISIIGVQVRNIKRGYPSGVVEEFELKDNIVLVASGKNDFLSVAIPLHKLSSDHIDQVVAVPLEASSGKTVDNKGRIWISCFVHSTPVWFLQHLVASTSLTNRLYEVESQLLIRSKKASIELRRLVSNSNLIEQLETPPSEDNNNSSSSSNNLSNSGGNNSKVKSNNNINEEQIAKPRTSSEAEKPKDTQKPIVDRDEVLQTETKRELAYSEKSQAINLLRLEDYKQNLISSINKQLTKSGKELSILCIGDVGSGKSSYIMTTLYACGIHRCLPEINCSLLNSIGHDDVSSHPLLPLFLSAKRKPHTQILEPYRPFNLFKMLDTIGFDERRKLSRKQKSIIQNAIFGRFPEYKSMKKDHKKLPKSKAKKIDIVLYFSSLENDSILSPQQQFEVQQKSSLWRFITTQILNNPGAPALGVVMTNVDRADPVESVVQRRSAFFESFGVPKSRILQSSNYVPYDVNNYLRKQERNFDKELEVLKNVESMVKWVEVNP